MTRQSIFRPLGVLCALLFIGLALASTGCDDAIQSVLEYRQDVYDAANDAWDEYIRM